MVLHRILFLWGNLFLSFLLGGVALVATGIFFPDVLDRIYDWATGVKGWVTGLGVPSRYNVWLKIILHESSIMLASFVLATRMVTSLVYALFVSFIWPGRHAEPRDA